MFKTTEDQKEYIRETYPEVTDHRIDERHWDLHCSHCNMTRGFQVIERSEGREYTNYGGVYSIDSEAPYSIYFRCPVCSGYKQWILYKISSREVIEEVNPGEEPKKKTVVRYYRVTSLPSEGVEDMEEIPENPPSLRTAYKQAIRAMDANAHIAAAAMFRRALQIITRDILDATPGSLAAELSEVVGKKYNGVKITNDFSDIGYILKEAGNQGAHPD